MPKSSSAKKGKGTNRAYGANKTNETNETNGTNKTQKTSYAEHKEQQKRIARAEKAVKESEAKIEQMEARLKELDELLMVPENASDMTLVTEYTSTKRALDEEVERWEQLSTELDSLSTTAI